MNPPPCPDIGWGKASAKGSSQVSLFFSSLPGPKTPILLCDMTHPKMVSKKKGREYSWTVCTVGVLRKKTWELISRDGHSSPFWGIILCNAKHLQLHLNKKQEHREIVHQLFYSRMLSFLKIYGVVGSVLVAKKFSLLIAPLSSLMVAG